MSNETVEQATNTPTAKVAAAGGGGAAALVLVFVAGQFGVEMPPEVAAALAALGAAVAGYFKRERA